jgi:Major Facilitator Superfamily
MTFGPCLVRLTPLEGLVTLTIRASIGHDQKYRRRWAALVVVCLAALIINVDNTILNVALPTLVRDLRATSSELQWIVDRDAMVFAGLLFVGGSLADRFGRRRFFLVGLTVFAGFERPDDPTIEFHLGHGDWIRLLRRNGFEILDLVELRPPPGATSRFAFVETWWADRWQCQEVWWMRKSR